MCLCIASASWLDKFSLVDVAVTFLFDWHLVHRSHNCMLLVWLFLISFGIHFPCVLEKVNHLTHCDWASCYLGCLSIYFCIMVLMFLMITMSASLLHDEVFVVQHLCQNISFIIVFLCLRTLVWICAVLL